MSKLSNLIEKVDHFYHTAINDYKIISLAAEPQSWTSPDDDDDGGGDYAQLYDRLINTIQFVKDSGAAQELRLIADQYQTANQIGDGFNTVRKKVDSFRDIQLPMYAKDGGEEEEEVFDEIDEILLDIYADLTDSATRAGTLKTGDSNEGFQAIKEVKDRYDKEERDALFRGSDGSTSDLSGIDPNAISTFDMSGGVGMEEAQKGSGRGYFVRTQKDPKDWIQSYENERKKYLEELSRGGGDKKTNDKKKKLIEVLDQLKTVTAQEAAASAQVQVAPDPAAEERLTQAREALKALKKERATIRSSLRQDTLARQADIMFDEFNKEKDPKKKRLLEQQLLLLKNLRSNDKNKGLETKLRKQMIAFLPHMSDTDVGKQTYQNLLKKIEEASKQKVSAEDYYREQGEVIYDVKHGGDFAAAFRTLKQHPPSVRSGDQKHVLDKWREDLLMQASQEERAQFGPLLDAIAEIRRGLPPGFSMTKLKSLPQMEALYQALKQKVVLFEAKVNLMKWRLARLNESFKEIEAWTKKVEAMSKVNNVFTRTKLKAGVTAEDFKPQLTAAEVAEAKALLAEIIHLSKQSYPDPFSGAERQNTKKFLEAVVDAMNATIMGTGKTSEKGWEKHKIPVEDKPAKPTKKEAPPKESPAKKPNPTKEVEIPETGEIVWLDEETGKKYEKDADGNWILWKESSYKRRMHKLSQILFRN